MEHQADLEFRCFPIKAIMLLDIKGELFEFVKLLGFAVCLLSFVTELIASSTG